MAKKQKYEVTITYTKLVEAASRDEAIVEVIADIEGSSGSVLVPRIEVWREV